MSFTDSSRSSIGFTNTEIFAEGFMNELAQCLSRSKNGKHYPRKPLLISTYENELPVRSADKRKLF